MLMIQYFLKPGAIQPGECRDELEVYLMRQIDRDMEHIIHKHVDLVFNILSITWSLRFPSVLRQCLHHMFQHSLLSSFTEFSWREGNRNDTEI